MRCCTSMEDSRSTTDVLILLASEICALLEARSIYTPSWHGQRSDTPPFDRDRIPRPRKCYAHGPAHQCEPCCRGIAFAPLHGTSSVRRGHPLVGTAFLVPANATPACNVDSHST